MGPQGSVGETGPAGPAGPAAARYELVGYTSQTMNADDGVFVFIAACQSEFPGSRWCTTADILDSTTVPPADSLTSRAWVRPTFVPRSTGTEVTIGDDNVRYLTDISGISGTADTLTCGGFSGFHSSSGADFFPAALAITDEGVFVPDLCAGEHSAACCAPRLNSSSP